MSETPASFLVDGQTVRGALHLPERAGRAPAILWLHGFRGDRMGPHRLFVEGARALATHGMASLRLDCRGAGDSDGEAAHLSVASMEADARAALAFLREHPAIDPTRLAIVGHSLGAAIAARLAQEAGLQALVLWSPVVFAVPIFARLGLYAAHPELARRGWVDSNGFRAGRQFLGELSALDPLADLAHWQHPLLVLAGGDDTVATSENAEALLAEIPTAEGATLAHADHEFTSADQGDWLIARTQHWLAGHLVEGAAIA